MAAARPLAEGITQTNAYKYGGAAALPQIQRAQRLADMLANLQAHGGENIKSPWQLGANLLATALLQKSSEKTNAALTQTASDAWDAQVNRELEEARKHLGGAPAAAPPPAPVQPGMTPPPMQPAAPAPAAPPLADAISPPPPGSRAGRNNNPGNIRADPNIKWQGQTGVDPAGFAIFDTFENGKRAADINLRSYGSKHGINTLSGVINRWAPPGENDTAGYVANMAKQTGLDPNAQIDLSNPQVRQRLMGPLFGIEGGGSPRPPMPPPTAPGAAPGPMAGPPVPPQPMPPQGPAAPPQPAMQGPPLGPQILESQLAILQRNLQHPNQEVREQAFKDLQALNMAAASPAKMKEGQWFNPATQRVEDLAQAQVTPELGGAGQLTVTPGGEHRHELLPGQAQPDKGMQINAAGELEPQRRVGDQAPGGGGGQAAAKPFGRMDYGARTTALKDLKGSDQVKGAWDAHNLHLKAMRLAQNPNQFTAAGLKDLLSRDLTDTVARIQMVKLQDTGASPLTKLEAFISTLKGEGNLTLQQRQQVLDLFADLDESGRQVGLEYVSPEKAAWASHVGNEEKDLDDLLPKPFARTTLKDHAAAAPAAAPPAAKPAAKPPASKYPEGFRVLD